MSQPTDQVLIKQMQAGDLQALGQLYDRYKPLVYKTALAITGDNEAAGDLLQDVFLRLYRFSCRFDPQRPLPPWLYRMTANLAYTWVKRDNRWLQPAGDLAEWLAGSSKDHPQAIVEGRDDWTRVQQAVQCLPISQRVVVVLYYLDDLSLQEISDILDIPMGTVKSRLHYGRLGLRKRLGLAGYPEGKNLPELNFEGS